MHSVLIIFNSISESDSIFKPANFLGNPVTSFAITTLEGLFICFVVLTAQNTLILLFVDHQSPAYLLLAIPYQAVQAHPVNLKIQGSAVWQSISACPLYLLSTACIILNSELALQSSFWYNTNYGLQKKI